MKRLPSYDPNKPIEIKELSFSNEDRLRIKNEIKFTGSFSWDYSKVYSTYDLDSLAIKSDEIAVAWLQLLTNCNNRCLFCHEPSLKYGMINLTKVLPILEELATKGVKNLTISGGEATIVSGFLDLINELKSYGYQKIELLTNARMMANQQFCEKLIATGITRYFVSVQGYSDNDGDEINGVAGSYEEGLNGLRNLVKLKTSNIEVIVNHVITKLSVSHLDKISELMGEIGVEGIQFSLMEDLVKSDFVRSLAPSMSEISKNIGLAVSTAKKNNIKIQIEGIPPCALPGCEEYYLDHKRSNNKRIKINCQVGENRDRILINRGSVRDFAHIYSSQCAECLYRKVCKGIYYTYFNFHDESSISPITNRDQILGLK